MCFSLESLSQSTVKRANTESEAKVLYTWKLIVFGGVH